MGIGHLTEKDLSVLYSQRGEITLIQELLEPKEFLSSAITEDEVIK